jgi:hypothetical protein
MHRELFGQYSQWTSTFLEVAATAGAIKGFTEVTAFFHWKANNTGVTSVAWLIVCRVQPSLPAAAYVF